jgi:telomere length regulation protein
MKDSDDEGEDSDDEDPSNKTVSKPVYIRQLLEYFKAPDGDDQYDKLDIALKTAARLILEKSKYGNEVKVHAKDLAKALVQFKDNFDFPDYHKHRTQALVVLVGTQPEIAPYIVDLFYTADISINDRLLLLTSLSLGARFVNGFTDTVDVKPMEMKKLPAAVAARFNDLNIGTKSLTGTRLTGTSGLLDLNNQSALPAGDASEDGVTAQPLNSVSSDLQQTLLSPTIAESRESEALNGPKVLRVSSSLQKQRQGQTNTTITTNHFSKVAHLFIFPLIDSWWKAGTGIMAGSFSSIIQAHYFKTLALLLYTAAPSAPKLTDMTSELLAMLLKLRSYVYIDDPQVIESACNCILVVLDTHSDEYIVQKWPREFVDLQKWLEDVWEGVIDERVKGVAAGVLYQMKKLGEKWRRSLVAY